MSVHGSKDSRPRRADRRQHLRHGSGGRRFDGASYIGGACVSFNDQGI
jgi:hypothetical protein